MTNAKPFVPTEDELVSLGFKKEYDYYQIVFPRWIEEVTIFYSENKIFWMEIKMDWMEDRNADCYLYPKSIEELKTLISMMNP